MNLVERHIKYLEDHPYWKIAMKHRTPEYLEWVSKLQERYGHKIAGGFYITDHFWGCISCGSSFEQTKDGLYKCKMCGSIAVYQ